jgi:hypothetical protein
MKNKKVVGEEYKDEYKRKHRSKFLSDDAETKNKYGIFKVTDLFKPEHQEHFKSLYPYDETIVDQYKLPEDKKEKNKINKSKKLNLKGQEKIEEIKEEDNFDEINNEILEDNKEE